MTLRPIEEVVNDPWLIPLFNPSISAEDKKDALRTTLTQRDAEWEKSVVTLLKSSLSEGISIEDSRECKRIARETNVIDEEIRMHFVLSYIIGKYNGKIKEIIASVENIPYDNPQR